MAETQYFAKQKQKTAFTGVLLLFIDHTLEELVFLKTKQNPKVFLEVLLWISNNISFIITLIQHTFTQIISLVHET